MAGVEDTNLEVQDFCGSDIHAALFTSNSFQGVLEGPASVYIISWPENHPLLSGAELIPSRGSFTLCSQHSLLLYEIREHRAHPDAIAAELARKTR